MDKAMKSIEAHLLKHNIKPSYQRIRIMEYLLSKKSHPTVDEIYTALTKEIPTLSKTTVYNTLNLLMNAKLTRLLSFDSNESRYDADISNHGHFICEKCGSIYDFRINTDKIETEVLSRFVIHEKNVYYKGVCFKCLDNNNL